MIISTLAFALPNASDLWAFYLLAAVWLVIAGGAWILTRALSAAALPESERGL